MTDLEQRCREGKTNNNQIFGDLFVSTHGDIRQLHAKKVIFLLNNLDNMPINKDSF